MGHNSVSASLHALKLLRQAAREYNDSDYKFYQCGFVKFKRESENIMLIEDIYIEPCFRGTEVASIMLEQFNGFMKKEGVAIYYGRVMKGSNQFKKRIDTFTKWGMKVEDANDYYCVVHGTVR